MCCAFFQGFRFAAFLFGLVFASFLLGACSGLGGHSFERRNIQTVFVGHGITRYFLPRLPWWANRSPAGRCVRGTSMQMFHMPLVRGSFNLTYPEAHQLQLMFNVELERAGEVSLQGEEEIFFRVSDKVMAGVRLFHPPTHHRVHLIWADPFFAGKNGAVRLQRLLKSPPMQKGHPVLVSLCRSYRELGARFAPPGPFRGRHSPDALRVFQPLFARAQTFEL